MKRILTVVTAAFFAASATAQAPPLSPEPAQPKVPKEAPPGKLCLLQSPDRCDQSPPQIIRQPYRPGEVELYELEKPSETAPKSAQVPPLQK